MFHPHFAKHYASVKSSSSNASFGVVALSLALPSASLHPPPTSVLLASHPQWNTHGDQHSKKRKLLTFVTGGSSRSVIPISIPLPVLLPHLFRSSFNSQQGRNWRAGQSALPFISSVGGMRGMRVDAQTNRHCFQNALAPSTWSACIPTREYMSGPHISKNFQLGKYFFFSEHLPDKLGNSLNNVLAEWSEKYLDTVGIW